MKEEVLQSLTPAFNGKVYKAAELPFCQWKLIIHDISGIFRIPNSEIFKVAQIIIK
jgi:hypothetical protein